jgi:hypothetical protein
MRLVFFKRHKPRRFDYKPIYYDPVQEELDERKKELDAISEGDPRARLKAEIRRKWHRRDEGTGSSTYKGIRIIVYFFIAILSIYYIFFTDLIENMFKIFGGR